MSGQRLTWTGHSTVLLELGQARLMTDPVLRDRIVHLRRHAKPVAAPGPLDAVLLSHLHHDHLDLPSLRRLDPAAVVLGPRGTARALRYEPRDVRELAPGETVAVGGLTVRAVPALHDGRRSLIGPPAKAIGFVVEGVPSVYFAGDTGLFAGMADLAGLDVALVPISGWGPRIGPGHMDPGQAAEAVALLQPALAIPIHWGTFLRIGLGRSHAHLLRDPPRVFEERVRVLAPEVRVAVLGPGESLELPPGPPLA